MDIQATLLADHSKRVADRIVKYVGKDKSRFAALFKLFLEGEYRLVQRAAWPLSYCVKAHPELIKPYFSKLIRNLDRPGLPVAVLRNTMRLLQHVEIPKRLHGRVMDLCFRLVGAVDTPIAVKAFSLTVLEQLAVHYPEILPELKTIIGAQWDQATPAFRSRARKIIG